MKSKIGALEEVMLLAVKGTMPKANQARIAKLLNEAGHGTTAGAAYITLGRLTKKGFVRESPGENLPRVGGRISCYYDLTAEGKVALAEAEAIRLRLREASRGLEQD